MTMLAQFEGISAALAAKLGQLSQARWEQTARLRAGRQIVVKKTVGELLWLFHFDLIHHRGQLTTYLRPMGSNVPSIYGKSADATAGCNSRSRRVNSVLKKAGGRV